MKPTKLKETDWTLDKWDIEHYSHCFLESVFKYEAMESTARAIFHFWRKGRKGTCRNLA